MAIYRDRGNMERPLRLLLCPAEDTFTSMTARFRTRILKSWCLPMKRTMAAVCTLEAYIL